MPAFSFKCPKCGKNYENVKASMAGRKVSCKCGHVFRLGPKTQEQIARDAKLAAESAEKKRIAKAKAERVRAEKERLAEEQAAMAKAKQERDEKLKAAKEKLELEKSETKWKSDDDLDSLMNIETIEPQNDLALLEQDEFQISDSGESGELAAVAADENEADDPVDELISNLAEDNESNPQESSGEFDLTDDSEDVLLKGLVEDEELVVAAVAADDDDVVSAVAIVDDEPAIAAVVVEDEAVALPVEDVVPAVPVVDAPLVSDLLPGPPTTAIAAVPVEPDPEQVVSAIPVQPIEDEIVAAIPVAPASPVSAPGKPRQKNDPPQANAVRAKAVGGAKPINLAPFAETPEERAEFE